MRRILTSGALAAAMAIALAIAPAQANDWRVAPGRSSLQFLYKEDGAPAQGRFTRFDGVGAFSRSRPSDSRFTLTIDVASITLRDRFRDDFVKNEVWFNTARYPTATFQLTGLRRIGGDRYRATGVLAIKDVRRQVSTQVTLRIDSDTAVARGEIAFDRFDYHVGDRLGSLFVEISDDVAVRFELVAERN